MIWLSGAHPFFTFLWSFSRRAFGKRFLQFSVDLGCLGISLWAPVGSHGAIFSATDFKSIFKVRFPHI